MVEGDEKAAVIDTGITTGKKIMPLLRELTDKPLLLVVTHVHWDHIYHMDEFEEVYMCHDEKKIDETTLRTLTIGRLKPWNEIHDIHTDSVISLGGTELRICQGSRTHTGKRSYSGNQGEITCSLAMRSEADVESGCRFRDQQILKHITTVWFISCIGWLTTVDG